MTDKVKWAYFAGIFDGEGTVSITKQWHRQRNKDWREKEPRFYWQYGLKLSLSNTDVQPLKWLVKYFGGACRLLHGASDKHTAAYTWEPQGVGTMKKILLGLLPYLIIKRDRVKLALLYIDLGYGEQEKREELFQKMRILNCRGITPTTNTPNGSNEPKIESDLHGNMQCAPVVTREIDDSFESNVRMLNWMKEIRID